MNDSSRMFSYSNTIDENENLTSAAVRYRDTEDPEALALFLHLFEPNINKVVGSAVKTYGHVSLYEDLKLACVFAIMDKLPRFDPEKGTVENYLKYPMMHAVQEEIRCMRSGFPISTKSTDPLLRKIMWLYHENSDRHDPEALAEIGRQVNRKPKTVLRYILDGTTNEIIYEEDEKDKKKREDEEKEDPLLTARGNPEWEPENSLLQSEQSSMVISPFAALGNVNRDIVSLHLGFCENCFRPAEKQTFQALALRNKRRSAQAAENIYYRSLNQMRDALVERGFLHTVWLNRLKKTKAAVAYAYQADNDGEWGEIEYDCKTEKFTITKLAELDLTKSQPFAKQAIRRIRYLILREDLRKKDQIWFPL